MDGVGAVPDTSQAIEGGNPEAGSEIAIGAAAYRGLAQFPTQVAGDVDCLVVELDNAGCPFQGRAVDASGDLQLAFAIEGLQGAQLPVDYGSVFHARHANVEAGRSLGCNHVDARSAAD